MVPAASRDEQVLAAVAVVVEDRDAGRKVLSRYRDVLGGVGEKGDVRRSEPRRFGDLLEERPIGGGGKPAHEGRGPHLPRPRIRRISPEARPQPTAFLAQLAPFSPSGQKEGEHHIAPLAGRRNATIDAFRATERSESAAICASRARERLPAPRPGAAAIRGLAPERNSQVRARRHIRHPVARQGASPLKVLRRRRRGAISAGDPLGLQLLRERRSPIGVVLQRRQGLAVPGRAGGQKGEGEDGDPS